MTQEATFTPSVIPSNKFYAPHIDHSQALFRTSLLKEKFPDQRHNKKVIIIEAQAGQGKTTLAGQFLHAIDSPSLWYQVGPEDADPFVLLAALLQNLTTHLPGFTSPQLASILAEGSVGPLDIVRCANLLLRDLETFLTRDIYLVFDDLHLISFGTLAISLLEHLVDTSPPMMHFIFISRHPIEIKGKTIRNGSTIAYLNTADLALNKEDIENLFHTVLKKDISRQEAGEILRITNGWIMGIILASHPISGRSRFWQNPGAAAIPAVSPTGHLLDYFKDEIFSRIPQFYHRAFLRLSFLQEMPGDLAQDISAIADFGRQLAKMAGENFFVYKLDDVSQVFRFHHFFQEFLQQRGREALNREEIADIHRREAHYYLARDLTEKALTCYRNAGDYQTMEHILKEQGMNLIAKNRTITILSLLQTIPEEILHNHDWLTLYAGLLRIDFAPQTTLPYFDRVRPRFEEKGEVIGELIALSQTIYYHFVISGRYIEGSQLLPRTEALLTKHMASLPMPIMVMACRNLASGYCFFNGELDKARHYIQMATSLATRHDIRNFIASTRFIQGYIELLSGNRAKYLREGEICFSLFNDPLVGESNRLTMRIMNLCHLSMIGDHQNFYTQQLALQASINHQVIDQTVAAPYLFVWGASNLFSLGRTDEALQLLDKGWGITSTAATDHMHSQILQWQAFGLALSGYAEGASQKIAESVRLRGNCGGLFYIAFNAIIAGAVHTRLKCWDEAGVSLEKGVSIAQRIPSIYLTISALFNLAFCKLSGQGEEAALDPLETGLSLMKKNGYNHFWTWEPQMMRQLLSLAVKRDIHKNFAQTLARKRLQVNFADSGEPIPLLNFTLLDHFEISIAGKILFRAKDLTYFQREILGLLLTAKGQRIPQEKIIVELWPESPPANARKSFDTLLTRLRQLLAPHLPTSVKDYLFIQKGILCLTNYQIDALQFLEAARAGMTHSKNGDWLQAFNAFRTALSLWKGGMPDDTFQSEQVLAFNDSLNELLVEVGMTLATSLAGSQRLEEAIAVVERILQRNYRDERLTGLLYQLHCRNNNPLKSREVLERYKKALLKAEYSEEETADYLEEIVNGFTAKEARPLW
jgi:ATP/maltotriose-dependent transcriptional regulator MalT/DNA-binding SARP family transcriptional activator